METMQVVVGAIFLILVSQSEAGLPKYFKDCGSKLGTIKSVSVSGCADTDEQCKLVRGTTVHVVIQFEANQVITNATAVVHGILAGIPVPFKIDETDGCKSGLNCPVKSGTIATYKSDIKVLKIFPSVKVVVKWELKDPSSNEIFCALFKSEIV